MSRMPAASPASTIDDVETAEDLRVARHRLREQQPAFDVGAKLADDRGEVLVVGLLLEDHERADDVQAGLDHRRELAREDLQRLRLDRLEDAADAVLAARGKLVQLAGEQPADPQLLARCGEVGCVDLARELEALGVDRGVGEGSHPRLLSDGGRAPLEGFALRMPIPRDVKRASAR